MIPLLGTYLALFLLIAILYFVSQKLRKGPKQSFWQWLKAGFGAQRNDRPSGKSIFPTQQTQSSEDVVAVLEDIYEEFTEKTDALKNQFDHRVKQLEGDYSERLTQLTEELGSLREEIRALRTAVNDAPAKSTQDMSDAAVRLTTLPRDSVPTELPQQSPPAEAMLPHVQSTGITAYAAVAQAFLGEELPRNPQLRTETPVTAGVTAESLQQKVEETLRTHSAIQPPEKVVDEKPQMRRSGERYFEILDELHAGKDPLAIAKYLRVSLEDVEQVQKIMQSPGGTDSVH